jgi:hypothetical protein
MVGRLCCLVVGEMNGRDVEIEDGEQASLEFELEFEL